MTCIYRKEEENSSSWYKDSMFLHSTVGTKEAFHFHIQNKELIKNIGKGTREGRTERDDLF